MSRKDELTNFWSKLDSGQKASLTTLCTTMSRLRTPRQHAELVMLVTEPEAVDVFEGFGDGNDPLLLPILRVLVEKPTATFVDVFEHLSEK